MVSTTTSREYEVPALADRVVTGGLADTVVDHARQEPGLALFALPREGGWTDLTAAEFHDQVVGLASGLLASGIEAGDRVALMARTRYEWTALDYAIWMIGACSVPVYPTSSASQIQWILADSGAVACVVETAEHAATLDSVRRELPELTVLWTIDDGAIEALRQAGAEIDPQEVERRRQAVDPDQPATIVYTSGTTGSPKGCVLSHANFFAEVDNAIALLLPAYRKWSRRPPSTVIFIPLAHVLGRMLQVACVRAKVRVGHSPSIDQADLRAAFRSFRPTFLLGVPYVFEKVFDTARHTADTMGRASSFDRAVRVGTAWAEAIERRLHGHGRGPGIGLWLAYLLYDVLVYRRIRKELGGRLRAAICGGSPLGRRLGLFFAAVRIFVLEGYGLTETTAAATVNPPTRPRFGTVGQPLPGTTVRIADDGEILIRGGQVFGSYWRNQNASVRAASGGWMHTGDIGELDQDGYLTVIGRKKEILVTSGGKNVAPAPLEDAVRAHPLVGQCVVLGDGRPFVSALITIDPDGVREWAKLHLNDSTDADLAELARHPDVLAEVRRAVDKANRQVSRAESVRTFELLAEDFTEDNGLLTPSMKVRRDRIMTRYADLIERIYSSRARFDGERGRNEQ